ncbi:PQQ-dependent dehydrogenase, methanol/ethanol family [Altererythrobacter sp. KTW20L]|uniref:PQQ-dependent dehydrogenase, methanol/ethanol family n=1 Tax=Altererythrobacter sp. KTW20L TaxID=2942210 RepID=UPI0020BE0BA3|nr:PQQ-dependent dehydrogenase, methanol/ethanol family [Altererythrobacter sp. KTW20L]MCL6252056.1 PQQ-dependent dehydrogenase, methanol/ethanol family [Altererythrobacter sp. KTW20L]
MIRQVRLALMAGLLLAGGIPWGIWGGIAGAQNSEAVEPGQWVSTGRTWDEQRFSPLDQINAGNVGNLGLAWYADLNTDRGQEATPLVLGRVLYNTEPWNIVTAYDAATGRQLWRYDPQVPLRFGREACCDIVTRGLAAWDGKIMVATLDGRLIALDAANGEPLWSVQTTDQTQGYTITGAPRVYDGRVLIGNAGAENGVRGYVSAYDAESGEMLWRWYTVPGNPELGFENEAMERAAQTWTGNWWHKGGGGTVWDSLAFDPALGLVYVGTGNGSPWAYRYRSPGGGDNLYLASIVALDIATGEYRWHYQTTPGETWDYTATQNMILADLTIGGRMRQVIMQAPKNGFFYVLDRATGELVSAEAIAPISWASGVDMATGRPIENPEARFGTIPVMVSPGAGGAHNWNPMAFSPQTGLVYIPVTETYMAYAEAETYDPASRSLGTAFAGHDDIRREIAAYADAHSKGWLAAWDPVTQTERWRVPYDKKGSGGVLATGGNLVFQGTIGTTFAAYRADTGEKVWEMPVHNVPIAAPITYMVDGVQYVAVNAGWGGGLAHVERGAYAALFLGQPRLLVFRLGGRAELPPMPAESFALPELAPPPPLTATPEQVALGEQLYGANCSLCHGNAARGGIKDLRHMSPATHAAFADIVLGGTRAANGMASFADLLSPEQSEAVHHYLIARANQDWTGE